MKFIDLFATALSVIAFIVFLPACGGGESDGGGTNPDLADSSAPGTDTTPDTDCVTIAVTGDLSLVAPSATLTLEDFTVVSASATHKVDIDAQDQCLSSVEIVLSAVFENEHVCRLFLRGSTLAADDSPPVLYLDGEFAADSFCAGFPDSDEGTYQGIAGTAVVDASFLSAGSNICASASIALSLTGSLTHSTDVGKTVSLQTGNLTVAGGITSAGSTDNECMEVVCIPSCSGKNCGDDGCGGSCGECNDSLGEVCNGDGSCFCEPITTCAFKRPGTNVYVNACGDIDDGCGGTLACGACLSGSCTDEGLCEDGGACANAEDGGACANAEDGAILQSTNVQDSTTVQVTSCVVAGESGDALATCIADKLVAETGLSAECACCFGESGNCLFTNCPAECGPGSTDPTACDTCIATNCSPAFVACSGLN